MKNIVGHFYHQEGRKNFFIFLNCNISRCAVSFWDSRTSSRETQTLLGFGASALYYFNYPLSRASASIPTWPFRRYRSSTCFPQNEQSQCPSQLRTPFLCDSLVYFQLGLSSWPPEKHSNAKVQNKAVPFSNAQRLRNFNSFFFKFFFVPSPSETWEKCLVHMVFVNLDFVAFWLQRPFEWLGKKDQKKNISKVWNLCFNIS